MKEKNINKKKFGFTLIELLAVIVILAIIALIATPIILGIVEDARRDSFMRSVELVVGATNMDVIDKLTDKGYKYGIINGSLTDYDEVVGYEIVNFEKCVNYFVADGEPEEFATIMCNNEQIPEFGSLSDVAMNDSEIATMLLNDGILKKKYNDLNFVKNIAGMNGSISYDKNGKEIYAIYNEKYCVVKTEDMDKVQIKDYVEGECHAVTFYKNGQRVYFDVDKGIGCTKEEYEESYDGTDFANSLTDYNGLNGEGTQNSCLLFYAFNDDGGEKVNLILDHNVVGLSHWTDQITQTNTNGPESVLFNLKNATDLWKGTIISDDYTLMQIGTYYVIPYKTESYKARLITAQEVAQIIGADNKEGVWFIESKSNVADELYFDEEFSKYVKDVEDQMAEGTISYEDSFGILDEYWTTHESKYGWLYDRTFPGCTSFGCLNNTESLMYRYWTGYWTATSAVGDSGLAWFVNLEGSLIGEDVNDGYNTGGVRPVITVLRTNITPGEAPIIPE